MNKMRIIGIMSILLAIGCGQKEKLKLGVKPAETQKPVNLKNRPSYAIKAPDFTLRTVQGDLFKLSDYQGKVVLLNFWGTWCGPCRREIPDLNELHKKYEKNGLEIVGLTITSGSPKNIIDFMEAWDMEYTVLTDINNYETQIVTAQFGRAIGQPITGLTTSLIIDQEGYIVKGYIGPRSENTFFQDLKSYIFP